MTALWMLAGIFLVLLLLAQLRFRIFLGYQEDGFHAFLRIGLFHIQIYPEKQKKTVKKKPKVEQSKKKSENSFLTQLTQNQESLWKMLQDLCLVGKELMDRFQEKLRVDLLRFQLTCALEDPADAALFYGHANAVMCACLPLLERWFTIKKKEIEISLDFAREKPQLIAQAQFSLTFGQMLTLGAFALTKGWQFYKTHRAKRPNPPKQKQMQKAV